MKIPTQVTFRNVDHSEAAAARVEEETEKLEKFFDGITSCRVQIETPHRHHHNGDAFHVRIELGVPGKELVVGREPAIGAPHKDLYVAIRDAFMAMRRQLQDYVHCLRNEVKAHTKPTITSTAE